MVSMRLLASCAALALACAACGGHADRSRSDSVLAIDLARTRPAGPGPAFRPPAVGNPAVAAGAAVGALRCGRAGDHPYGAHIELFARGRGMVVPAGIGIAPPQHRKGAFVVGGRCVYPLRTVAPTGVVLVDSRATPTVGQLFDLWGLRLSRVQLAAFRGSDVVAFVDGRRWNGDPRAILLRRHAQIELELGPLVPPHPVYLFPGSL